MRFKDAGTMRNSVFIDTINIDPDPEQPRKEFDEFYIQWLANDIHLSGQLEPAVVRSSSIEGRWVIVSGENRWRACKIAGKPLLCVQFVPDKSLSPEKQHAQIMYRALAGNTRKPLTESEWVGAIKVLIERDGCSIEEVAQNTGKSIGWIRSSLKLDRAPEEVQQAAKKNIVSKTAAGELAKAPEQVRKKIIEKAETTGRKVTVGEVQKETQGAAAIITRASIERIISFGCSRIKSDVDPALSEKWDFGIRVLQCALGKVKIEEIENVD